MTTGCLLGPRLKKRSGTCAKHPWRPRIRDATPSVRSIHAQASHFDMYHSSNLPGASYPRYWARGGGLGWLRGGWRRTTPILPQFPNPFS
ncbi:Uncharacterized protein HZ326_21675 [Fusarium oxysporum f. sp. albedinis]|nr:Uncharacterized protein HZ326_21675 [Fusarium oxysporum f. sp. albedinis]